MSTKLTDTSKAAIFSVLVLLMAVGAALLLRAFGVASEGPSSAFIWAHLPWRY
jgi:hypothetical protein